MTNEMERPPTVATVEGQEEQCRFASDQHSNSPAPAPQVATNVVQLKKPRFLLKRADAMRAGTRAAYLVKDFLPRVGVAVMWGPAKSLKTFVVVDLSLHIAYKYEAWHGLRCGAGPVVYCCYEGNEGLRARMEAFHREWCGPADAKEGHPCYVIDMAGILERDHKELIEDIRAQMSPADMPTMVILDTLNRGIVDDGSGKEMGAYINAASAIASAFQCCVLIIHHCGWDRSRVRGSSALIGNCDVEISVTRGGETVITRDGDIVTATVQRAKDMKDGTALAWQVRLVQIGTNEDGEAITSLVLVPTDLPAPGDKKKRLSDPQQLAVRALAELAKSKKARPLPDDWGLPAGMVGIAAEDWRRELESRGDLDATHARAKQRFYELKNGLKKKGVIGERDGLVWSTNLPS
jgi:hypothetical protein